MAKIVLFQYLHLDSLRLKDGIWFKVLMIGILEFEYPTILCFSLGKRFWSMEFNIQCIQYIRSVDQIEQKGCNTLRGI